MARGKLEALDGVAASHLLSAVMLLGASEPWPAQGFEGLPTIGTRGGIVR